MQAGTEDATVLYVKHNTYAITWLALNQSVSVAF
jgi:hypothetical protein